MSRLRYCIHLYSLMPGVMLGALALAACAGNGEGLDAQGRPLVSNPQALLPTFQSIQDHVFTPICAQCHVGAAAPLGFRLDAAASYAMLINTPSVEVPGLRRISPGDPNNSYLIQKIEGHASVGAQMPLGGPALSADTIAAIRQWVTDGALATAATANAATQNRSTILSAVDPMPDQVLDAPPREILIAANGELNLAAIGAHNISLQRSGGDGQFDDGNDITITPISIAVHSVDPTILALSIPANQWTVDRYRLRLSGTGPMAITDLVPRPVDGAATGNGGSDLVLQFDVGFAQ